ncbi:MAG: pentapeptide repeat-containing protein [Chloroflexi bacterium]|nr:pentapeptide repeat-containing protein [Chloroflexota bacterium]MCI0579007.1 pentapeptide repeat-containing protein [Chloroflexota bacterium]MCI0644794.1 pentapeptide repeat-containing protein [Chloroflexota bacterium]MCI0731969.1 pentapeptide repeat-containing protein [Chloroflexota bacterium]
MSRANLAHANLAGAVLKDASLTKASLMGANLEGADLERAVLQGADLRQASLKSANLTSVYARWADFRGANLNNADLRGADLEAARLEETSLENTKLAGIHYNRATTWPAGFRPHQVMMTRSPEDVMTISDLINFLVYLSNSQAIDYEGSLEHYLRALWGVLEKHRVEPASPHLVARLFVEAFHSEPIAFDESWHGYVSTELNTDTVDDYSYLQHILLSQIVELQIVSEKSTSYIPDNLLSSWANLLVEYYLEAGVRGFYDYCQTAEVIERASSTFIGRPLQSQVCTWRDMAEILELGKMYE